MVPRQGGAWAAKHCREWVDRDRGCGPKGEGVIRSVTRTAVKRSFRRACLRVVRYGETTYRGRRFHGGHMSSEQWQQAVRQQCSKVHCSVCRRPSVAPASASELLHTMVWNCGGLPYHEFLHWASTEGAGIHVMIIAETRMAQDMEFSTESHHVVHSAGPHAGIMILIHKRVAPATSILMPGRLVHVGMYDKHRYTDIVGVYQQAWQPHQPEKCKTQRRQLLHKLDGLLHTCSSNQLLFMGGDFNTEFEPSWPIVGKAVAPTVHRRRPRQEDCGDLLELMQKHQMGAVNTYQSWRPTFVGRSPNGADVAT